MSTSRSGPRRSSALRTQRALLIVAALQSGDHSTQELIEQVERIRPGLFPSDPVNALQKDMRFARNGLGCDIRYRRKLGAYVLLDSGIVASIAPIRPADMPALAAVRSAFAKPLPLAAEVNELLNRLLPDPNLTGPLSIIMLSDGRWDAVREVVCEIDRAHRQKQRLEFTYRSTKSNGTKRHVVEVQTSCEFRDGHLYLDAYSVDKGEFHTYRVDRIVPGTPKLLPTRIAPRERRWTHIRYRLSPEAVSDQGATKRFRNHSERYLPDGWIEITADAPNVFTAGRTLLHYGDSCIAEAPEELVTWLRSMASALLARYETKPHK